MLGVMFGQILTTSISMSIVLVLLLMFSPRLNRVFLIKWKYWLWLAVSLRMLLPVQLNLLPVQYRLEVPSRVVTANRLPAQMLLFSSVSAPEAPFYSISVLQICGLIWIVGAAFMAVFHLLSYRRTKRVYLRWSLPCNDKQVTETAAGIGREMQIGRLPAIYICHNVPSPMIIGFFRHFLLLPDQEYQPKEIAYILQHELVHLKRRDIWYKLVLLAVACVHWFNPVSYLLLREASRDLEMLCDDAVVKHLDAAECRQYGRTILAAAQGTTRYRTTILSTSFRGGVKSLKARLQNLLETHRRKGTAAYCIAFAVMLATSSLILFLPVHADAVIQLQDQTINIPGGVRGVDVSQYQGEIDWEQVAGDDIHFAFVRASYGLEQDPAFRKNVQNARAQGLDVGAWHYAHFTDRASMQREAEFFLKQLEPVEITLPAILEMGRLVEVETTEFTQLCLEFMGIVEDAGYSVALGTYTSYYENYLDVELLQDTDKWIMNYLEEPDVGQQFWQYTSEGAVKGIDGAADINIAYSAMP